MNYLEASIDDLEQIIEMRLEFIASDQGAIETEDIKAMKEQLPGYLQKISVKTYLFLLLKIMKK